MTWVEALALSVPLAVALWMGLVNAAQIRAAARRWTSRRESDAADERAREGFKTALKVARIEAEARVRAAKYESRAIKTTPKAAEPEERTPFQDWLAQGGSRKPQHVQDAVEFAFSYVAGEDSGSEAGDAGSPEGAKEILNREAGAGWHSAAVEHARRMAGRR